MCRRKGKSGGKEKEEHGEINSDSQITCLFTFCFHWVLQLLSEENNLNIKTVQQHTVLFAEQIISTHLKLHKKKERRTNNTNGEKNVPGSPLTCEAFSSAAAGTVLSLIPSTVRETTWLGSLDTMGPVGWLKEKGEGEG